MTSPPKIKKIDIFTHVDRHGIYGAHNSTQNIEIPEMSLL